MTTTHLESSAAAQPEHLRRPVLTDDDLVAMMASTPTMAAALASAEEAASGVVDPVLAGARYVVTHGDLVGAIDQRRVAPTIRGSRRRRGGPVSYEQILVDDPAPMVRRITLNRPEKRNALNGTLRREILAATRELDADPDVAVTIIRGAGTCFSAGYDLSRDPTQHREPLDYTAGGEGAFMRGVTNGWMTIWDLAKPVIAQVHGYCLAGGSELATGCDLVYVAEDAQIGYPAVRFGTPDMQYHGWLFGMRAGMESMLTGDSFSGVEAAQLGWANRAYPADKLEDRVLEIANRIAQIPSDVVQINKRTVHRGMEVMGLRAAIRAGTELAALATHSKTLREFTKDIVDHGVTGSLTKRDSPFGDYRTSERKDA